ncbi:MAG: exonuclease domain-containing protein, partial [Candidatus Kapaibacteriota bacterium]
GTIVEEYTSLVNPRQHIPQFIVQMTGITNEMVFTAPDFKKIAPEIKYFLSRENTVFVAHNVNFDYNFVKKSFERSGISFPEIPKLCTLKLSRRLINGTSKRNVGSLSEHLGIPLKYRHRAFGDAKATAQILLELLEIAENEHNITTTEELLKFQYKPYTSIAISEMLKNKGSIDFKDVPDSPGIYFFIDKYGNYLYIGKGRSLKNRIQSYFSSTTSKKILRLLQATKQIKWETTRTELRALIEESKAIKQYKPEFNILSKKYKNYPFIQISKHEHYPILEITYEPNPSESFCFGPFKNYETAQLVLEIIHKKFKLRKCDEELFKKHQPENCIYFQTKSCLAPCAIGFDRDVYIDE